MKKRYLIMGKGYFNTGVSHPFNLNLEISDIKTSYGNIEFTGTPQGLEKFVSKLMENEATFKVIDYFEKDSKEHREFLWGPDEILKPKGL
tara:strand:- start:9465 stop:9734 length:270 start_codon:yes stop_codon:yes gene_type:complete